jgi:mannose-6-phosphate isomerase
MTRLNTTIHNNPFLLSPAGKDYLWGGRRLKDSFSKNIPLTPLAETWECSVHPDGPSVVASGSFQGKKLIDVIRDHPEFLGTHPDTRYGLPILVKFIDAYKDLSVQVHPSDEYALKYENSLGKSEMWYVIDCARGAELIYGFKEKVTSEQFAKMIKDNTLLEYVNRVGVKKGDVFFIPSGTLHAIGKGILIAEIQQNSNTTYRVYDYGRVGADGKPRELHINKAIDVTNTRPAAIPKMPQVEKHQGYSCTLLAQCKYFTAVKYDVASRAELDIDHRSFAHLMVIDGQGEIDGSAGKKGDSFFIDASSGSVKVNGRCSFILSRKL